MLRALEQTSPEFLFTLLEEEYTKCKKIDWTTIYLVDESDFLNFKMVASNLPISEKEILALQKKTLSSHTAPAMPSKKGQDVISCRRVTSDKTAIYVLSLAYKQNFLGYVFLSARQQITLEDSTIDRLKVMSTITALALKNIELTQELITALDKKEMFMSAAAHELRTPLAVIDSYTQLMQKSVANDKPIKPKWVKTIYRNIRKLNNLVSDLFTSAEISRNLFTYSPRRINMTTLVTNIVNETRTMYDQTIDYEPSNSPIYISGDKNKLAMVLTNSINNAAKYSSKSSTIKIKCCQVKDHIKIVVSDSGIGIPKNELPQVFEKNFQGTNKKRTGLGLGLYLCKKIIDAHNGSITLSSKVSSGTTVTILLPIS